MKKIFTLLLILNCAAKLQAQFALASYQAINTTVYNAVDGSMEFTPTGTSGSPTNNQYLSIPASSSFEFTGDFTVECWVNFKNLSAGVFQAFLGQYTGSVPWILQMNGNQLRLAGTCGEVNSSTLSINTWYHIALVRSGTNVKIYVNGGNNGSTTIAIGTKIGDGTKINTIGAGDAAGNDRFNGFISNVRFVKGTAVYTSNFTPPTSRLTAIAGTTLLLNTTYDGKYLKDNSTNRATVTNYDGASTTTGLATSSPLNPFNFVSAGLIVNLDATNASSYPGTGTTWTNLGTGGTAYNATLTNDPTYESGSTANLYFNKPTTGDLQKYGTININTGATSAWSMEVIALVPNNSLWVQGTPFIQIADKAAGNNGLGSYIGVQGGVWNFYAGDNSQGDPISDNTWAIVTVVHSGSYQHIYVNGVEGEVKASAANSLNVIKPLYLGNPPTNTAGISVQQVKISRFKFYTRALSFAEIGSNFSVQKTRYGL